MSAQFTNYVSLDSIVNEWCSDMGDNFGHQYIVGLSHAVQFLRDSDFRFGGFRGVKYAWLPVVDGRVMIPDVTNISKVGVEIDGHIQPLLEDLNMLDRPDDCGGFSDRARPVNPDVPSVRSRGALPILYTGPYSYWGGFAVGGGAFTGAYGYGMNGYAWTSYYPGMSVRKSLYGYYRWFPQKGYLILDAMSHWDTIVIEYSTKSFEPGSRTLVPEVCADVIKAYIRAAMADLEADFSTKGRPLLNRKDQMLTYHRLQLRSRINRQPLYELWAVLR